MGLISKTTKSTTIGLIFVIITTIIATKTTWVNANGAAITTSKSTTTTTTTNSNTETSSSSPSYDNNHNLLFEYLDDLDSNEFEGNINLEIKEQQQKQQQKQQQQRQRQHETDEDDLSNESSEELNSDHHFDVLIFTQSWPVTTCFEWREVDKNHECLLPPQKEFWEIHGIWPTRIGSIGPNFCNRTANFDVKELQQILEQLQLYWGTVHRETGNDWLWEHEWKKHGTCAAALEELNNELKYFKQGLKWRNDYLISNILAQSNIHPDSNNTVIALQTAMIKVLGRNPSIHCVYDNKEDVSYLSEIRICFNKTLHLTDCDGVIPGDAVTVQYPGGTVNTNCHVSKPVHYPSAVPPVQRENSEKWKFPVVNFYKLIQFIMWFTL